MVEIAILDAVGTSAYARQSNTAKILGVTGAFYVVALALSCMRLYTRAVISKSVRKEDYAIIPSMASADKSLFRVQVSITNILSL